MADLSEQYLDEPSPNKFAIVTVDADGNQTTKSVKPSDALKYLNDSIAKWGTSVPKSGQTDEVISKEAVQDTLVRLAILVQDTETGRTPALYKKIAAKLQDPDAIALFTSDPRISRKDALAIWPNLDKKIAQSTPSEAAREGTGGQGGEAPNERAIAGATKDSNVPPAEKPGGGDTTNPPLASRRLELGARR